MSVRIVDGKVLIVGGELAVSEDCCCGSEPWCLCTDHFTGSFDVTISGVANNNCTNASAINGLWTIPWAGLSGSFPDCVWELLRSEPGGCAGNPGNIAILTQSASAYMFLRLHIRGGTGLAYVYFRLDLTTIGHGLCGSFVDVSFPFWLNDSGAAYDWSSATAIVTAVP
jgi:hypothetical protein